MLPESVLQIVMVSFAHLIKQPLSESVNTLFWTVFVFNNFHSINNKYTNSIRVLNLTHHFRKYRKPSIMYPDNEHLKTVPNFVQQTGGNGQIGMTQNRDDAKD